jgi:hypothetical protein
VRKRLNEIQASSEMFDAVDDAETDWRSYRCVVASRGVE